MNVRFMQDVEKLSFEEALGELEALVRRLEEGKCPLNEAIKTFEKGINLKNHCNNQLKSARLKVEQILENSDKTLSIKPFLNEEKTS